MLNQCNCFDHFGRVKGEASTQIITRFVLAKLYFLFRNEQLTTFPFNNIAFFIALLFCLTFSQFFLSLYYVVYYHSTLFCRVTRFLLYFIQFHFKCIFSSILVYSLLSFNFLIVISI